jgi:hypothetical protein
MHLKGQKPADLPVAQLTELELTRSGSNVPAHAARLLSVLHLLRSGIGTTRTLRNAEFQNRKLVMAVTDGAGERMLARLKY